MAPKMCKIDVANEVGICYLESDIWRGTRLWGNPELPGGFFLLTAGYIMAQFPVSHKAGVTSSAG